MTNQVSENVSTTVTVFEPDAVYGTNASVVDVVTEKIASVLNVYYTPLLVTFGSVGNLFSVFVFYSSKLRFQSTSQYLTALALSDTVFLFQLVPPWLTDVQFTGVFHRIGFCQLFVYTSYVTCCLSAWLVMAFTIERFVAVLYPLRRHVLCSVTRARYVIAILVGMALLLNLPVLRFAVPSWNDCNIDSDYIDHAARFNLVDTALSFTAPLGVITVMNAWIMVGVYRLQRARHQLMKAARSAGRSARPPLAEAQRSQHRVTRMLLIVSSVFVALNLPAYTVRILAYAYDMNEGEYNGRWAALQQIALMFFNTNFGINFILYCLSGQNFRRELRQTVPWLCRRARRAAATRRPVRTSSVSTSFVSNCTEASSNCGASSVMSPNADLPLDPVLKRWTFDNSRQYQARRNTDIELQTMSSVSSNSDHAMLPDQQGASRDIDPQYRTIPFNLFPYRRLLVPRSSNREAIGTVLYR